MKAEGVVELLIPARPKYLQLVRTVVGETAAVDLGLDAERIADLRLAVSEAVTNAIEAQVMSGVDDRVVVRCNLAGGCLLLGVACLHGLEPDLERTLHGKLWLLAPRMGSRAYVRCSGEPGGTKNGLQSLRFPLFRARVCIPGTSSAMARP